MTAPLPLPIAPFAIMAGDPASTGAIRPGEQDSLADGAPAGLAFGLLLQQILLTPAEQTLPGQAAESGNGPDLSLLASLKAAANSGSALPGAGLKPTVALPTPTGDAHPSGDGPAMRLVATLPDLARASLGTDGLASSSPLIPSSPVVQMATSAAAGTVPTGNGAGILAGQFGVTEAQPSSPSPIAAPSLALRPDAGPQSMGGRKMATAAPALALQQLEEAPEQAVSAAGGQTPIAPFGATALEAEQAVGGQAAGQDGSEKTVLLSAADPVNRRGASTAQVVGEEPKAQPAAPFLPEPLTGEGGRPRLSQAEQEEAVRPASASALSMSAGEGSITNLMQPAEAGLRLAFSAEEPASAKRLRPKVTAGRAKPAPGVASPSPPPRTALTEPIGPQQDSRALFMDSPAGSTDRAAAASAAPPSAGGSRVPAFSLPGPAPRGEYTQTAVSAPAGQLSPAASQPGSAHHLPTLAQALPQTAQASALPHASFSLGEGLTALPENVTAASPLAAAAPGSADSPAPSFVGLQQSATAQQQPHAAVQLGLALQYRIGRQETKFTLRLDPPELGRVEVSLKLHDGGRVDALIRTEHGHTLDLLQRDVRVLERAFHQLGLKPEGGIQFASGQQGHGHSGSPFSQPQHDGMGQPHAGGGQGGGQGEGGHERQAGEPVRHAAGMEGAEPAGHDDGSQERPLMAAAVGLDVKV